ncbi:hypothetical protein FRC06_011406 [Ceratobasidium sp. 370]|nr:hypothetical protein FRC06_011406 [Ceratobasidium sp. 370]
MCSLLDSCALPEDKVGMRDLLLSIAKTAKGLEGSVAMAGAQLKPACHPRRPSSSPPRPRIAEVRKSNRKTGRAMYAFDGVRPDPSVFDAMLKLDGSPTFKAKEYAVDEFERVVGCVKAVARWVPTEELIWFME